MILLDLGRSYDSGLQLVRTILTRRRQRYAGVVLTLALLTGCVAATLLAETTDAQEKFYWLERGSQIKGSCLGKTDGQDLSGRLLEGRLADTLAPVPAPSPSAPAAQTRILTSAPPPTSSPTPTPSGAAAPPPSEAQPRAPPTDTQTEASSAKDTDRPLLGGRISAEAVATAENQAYFWSGKNSGITESMEKRAISIAEPKGGKTLERILKERGTRLPSWNPNDPVIVQFFESVSREYAAGASGTVHAVIGELRPGSIWETVELPTLIANSNVKKIVAIDPVSGVERVCFSRH